MIEKICRWIVKRAGIEPAEDLDVRLRSVKPVIVNPVITPAYLVDRPDEDRPDILDSTRKYKAEIVAKDEALVKMQAAIEDLDLRLRRSDPIVTQAISQGSGSITQGMLIEIHRRVERVEGQMKQLAAPSPAQSRPLLGTANVEPTAEPGTPEATA